MNAQQLAIQCAEAIDKEKSKMIDAFIFNMITQFGENLNIEDIELCLESGFDDATYLPTHTWKLRVNKKDEKWILTKDKWSEKIRLKTKATK